MSILFRKFAIFCHRWLGVALCVFFLLWFTSAVVTMYRSFPSVTAQDRLDRSPALDASRIRLSLSEACARPGAGQPPGPVHLNTFDARPVYRFRAGRGERLVYVDTGEEQTHVSAEMIQRAAAAWTGQPVGTAVVESVRETDQWTVSGPLRNLRPLRKYSWPNGEQICISGLTGEVMQYTTRSSRFWAWAGAIPHWIYFTPLRKHQKEWTQFVIWTSGIATMATILGIVVGIFTYSQCKRYRYAEAPTSIPYRGQKRWHMILGLVFGPGAATWAFSGVLSMGPFTLARPETGPNIAGALRDKLLLSAFDAKAPQQALAQLGSLPARGLELTSFAGEPVYIAATGRSDTRGIAVRGEPKSDFETAKIVEVLQKAAGPGYIAELHPIDEYDAYYLDRRHEKPLPVLLAKLNDAARTRYYIDPKTARVVGNYSSSGWMSRWLYHGLHSLDFPWLYKYRPLWDIVVITFMLGGSALCITSSVFAWRVVRRTVMKLLPVARLAAPGILACAAQAQPARIVSTFPSVTETLFALGAGDRVVGVSNYCRYPPVVLSLPKIGSYTKPDPEKIALLHPDLAIVQKSAISLAERLSALGIRHAEIKVGSLADIYSMIRDIGNAVGLPDRAEKLNADIRSRLDAFRTETGGKPRPTVLIVLGRTPGLLTNLIAVGPGAYLGELLEIAGGRNVLTDTAIAYPHISLETVVRANPDVILDASAMDDTTTEAGILETRLRQPWVDHRELNAVRSGMILGLAAEPLTTPGPRVVEAVLILRAKIHAPKKELH
jgi:ABC-type Fe3+-hydroxamate transport system substrate-binding protein